MRSRYWHRLRVARGGAVAISSIALIAGGAQFAAASAPASGHHAAVRDPYSPAYRHSYRGGVVPTVSRLVKMHRWARTHQMTAADSANNLSYGGGIGGIGVSTGHEEVYLVFYGSQWGSEGSDGNGNLTLSGDPSGAAPYLQQFLRGLGTGGELWSGVMTQYCQGVAVGSQSCPSGNTQHVAYPSGGVLAGVWVDESAPSPASATGHQLGQEAINAAGYFGNTTAASNRNAQYVILSPTGTDPDGWLENGFCAWHDYNGDPNLSGGPVSSPYGNIAFTNMPYLTDAGANCGQDFVNGNGTLDGLSLVEGHEYAETITDTDPPGGWTDSDGEEAADKCVWISPGVSGGAFDLTTGTGTFAVQQIWGNDASGGTGGCEASHPIVGTPPPPPPPKTDLFVYNPTSGASYVELANGGGGWTGVKGPQFSAGWEMFTGDFTGNGLTDLFDYNPSTGASYVDLANGSGGWTGVKGPQFSAGWNVYTGRLTSNGLDDLFVYNPSTGASYVELANGSGGWTGVKGPQFSTGWEMFTGDFTGNGLTDLFDYNPSTGASYVDLANGSGGWTGVKGPQFSAGWNIYTGDFTGNGLDDLFDYNPITGASYVDLANGSGGWNGVAGPPFSAGWNVYTGVLANS